MQLIRGIRTTEILFSKLNSQYYYVPTLNIFQIQNIQI